MSLNESASPQGTAITQDRPDASSQSLQPNRPVSNRKRILAGGIGNFIEWYDYGVYGALTAIIAKLFFPSTNAAAGILATFAVFGAAFIIRPFGGWFFGNLGDRKGRKVALGLAVIMVSGSTFLVGLLPTYATAGIFAPLALLILRLLQGFSAGGEWTGSAVFMVESAPPGRRGWIASWQQFSVITGGMAGILLVTLITNLGSQQFLLDGGWRIPFLISLPLGVFGWYIRYRLQDSTHFAKVKAEGEISKSPAAEAIRTQRWVMFSVLFTTALPKIGVYTFSTYTPVFLTTVGKLPLNEAYLITTFQQGLSAILCLVFGRLSDRVGRRPLLLLHGISYFVLVIPVFLLMSSGSFWLALLAQVPAMLIMACWYGPGTAMLTEVFPTRLRYSGLALPYNVSAAVFGGTGPLIASALVAGFGIPLAAAFWPMLIAIPSTIAYVKLKETAFKPLADV